MGCSALTFGLQPNLEGEHECLCVYCVTECRVCMMWDARAVWHDGSSPRTAYRAVPDDFLASYLSCLQFARGLHHTVGQRNQWQRNQFSCTGLDVGGLSGSR